jgi:SAM-dependent methyltransferase
VFLLDVVEHLAPPELAAVLGEARRVLRPAGKAVIHTTPNRWSRTYGHALRSAAALVRGRRPPVHPLVADFRRLDADPRYDAMKALLHVNEQSVASLWWALRRAGFAPRVWLAEDGNRWRGRTDRAGAALSRLYRVTQLRYVFGWSMFAVASPRA